MKLQSPPRAGNECGSYVLLLSTALHHVKTNLHVSSHGVVIIFLRDKCGKFSYILQQQQILFLDIKILFVAHCRSFIVTM